MLENTRNGNFKIFSCKKYKNHLKFNLKEFRFFYPLLLRNTEPYKCLLQCKVLSLGPNPPNSLGDVHKLRDAIFQDFRPPSPLVTKNRTNPYVLTMVRNKSLTSPLTLRNLWTSPYVIQERSLFREPKKFKLKT
jgi:hypothetical protein